MGKITFEDLLNKKSTKGKNGSRICTDKYPIVIAISVPKKRKTPLVTMYLSESIKWNNGGSEIPSSLKVVFYDDSEDLYLLPADDENKVQKNSNGKYSITPNIEPFLKFVGEEGTRIGFVYKRDVPGAININLKEGVKLK